MTCKEKLIQDHPEWSEAKVDEVIHHECPEQYMSIDDPAWCLDVIGCCKKCWDREIPGTKVVDPVPITQTDYDHLCASGKVENDTLYQVYQTEEELQEAKDALATKFPAERTYTTPETSVRNTQCLTCGHKEVCIYRESFTYIMSATQNSNGICAHVEKNTIDLNSEPYIKLDISCKHYHRKAEVTRNGI